TAGDPRLDHGNVQGNPPHPARARGPAAIAARGGRSSVGGLRRVAMPDVFTAALRAETHRSESRAGGFSARQAAIRIASRAWRLNPPYEVGGGRNITS